MLIGLLYYKLEDYLVFLENCICFVKIEKDIKWNLFFDFSKKLLLFILKIDGLIKLEVGVEICIFIIELEMKQKFFFFLISSFGVWLFIDEDDKELIERNILIFELEEEVNVEFFGQRIVYVFGK